VLATPGHTNDSVSYRIGEAVFIGDTLFMPDGGSARCERSLRTAAPGFQPGQ
jgi:glyoxylase-like metal-dependent hydrolase (beta-lactamase superfamily II)